MIESKIDHVGLNVSDLEESIAFYKRLFDFHVIEKWEDTKQAFVGKDDVVLGLMEAPAYDFLSYTKAHIAFPCKPEAFEGVISEVKELSSEIISGPKPQRGGETVLFRDPSGNIIEVCYPSLKDGNENESN